MAHSLSPEAEAELDAIWLYVAEHGTIEYAERLIQSFTDQFFLLASFPYMGRAREDLPDGYRSLVVEEYIILYRVRENEDIIISHIMHGTLNIKTFFSPNR